MANFDDLDPLAAEPDVSVEIVPRGQALPGDADLVLLPGSKTTLGDLSVVREEGWDVDLAGHIRRGGFVVGICGGYQILGKHISDPDGIDGRPGEAPGLGWLDVTSVMTERKVLAERDAVTLPDGLPVHGYEIHKGLTTGPDCDRAWLDIDGRPAGAASPDGRVLGCYMHGLFASDPFRKAFLRRLGHRSEVTYDAGIEQALDDLADHLERHMDLDQILALSGQPAFRTPA